MPTREGSTTSRSSSRPGRSRYAASSKRDASRSALVTLGLYLFGSRAPGLAWLGRHVPVLQLQEPTRIVPIGALCLALTGAIGLDALLRRRRSAGIGKLAGIGAVLAFGLILAPDLRVGLVSAGILIAAAAARRAPRAALTLLAIALIADLIPWGRLLLPSGDPRLFHPRTDAMKTLVRAAGGPGGRAVGQDRQVYPGILSTCGLDDPRTHDPLAAADYHRELDAAFGFAPSSWNYFGKFEDPQHPLIDSLGVRAVFSHVHLPAIPGMRRILLTPPFFVAVNADALPRAFVTRDFEIVAKEELPAWIEGMTDPKRVALFAEEPVSRIRRGGLRRGDARVVDSGDGRVSIEVSGRGPRLLATSFLGPEGWRARSDGERLETLTVNGAFLGVVVPSKTRNVELVYPPPAPPSACCSPRLCSSSAPPVDPLRIAPPDRAREAGGTRRRSRAPALRIGRPRCRRASAADPSDSRAPSSRAPSRGARGSPGNRRLRSTERRNG